MVVYYNGYSIKQLKKALKTLKSANGDLCEIRYLSQTLRNRLRQNNNDDGLNSHNDGSINHDKYLGEAFGVMLNKF